MQKEKGQLLIEAIISISLATVGILGILAMLNRSFAVNRDATSRFIAATLAAEGIEVVKNIIDINIAQNRPWNSGISNGSFEVVYDSSKLEPAKDVFLKIDADGFYNHTDGRDTDFKRTIEIKMSAGGNKIQVNSIVSLRDGSFNVNLEDDFYNWR